MLGDCYPLNTSSVSHLVSCRNLHLGRNMDLGFVSVLVVILSRLTLSTIVGIIVLESYYGEIWDFLTKVS